MDGGWRRQFDLHGWSALFKLTSSLMRKTNHPLDYRRGKKLKGNMQMLWYAAPAALVARQISGRASMTAILGGNVIVRLWLL